MSGGGSMQVLQLLNKMDQLHAENLALHCAETDGMDSYDMHSAAAASSAGAADAAPPPAAARLLARAAAGEALNPTTIAAVIDEGLSRGSFAELEALQELQASVVAAAFEAFA